MECEICCDATTYLSSDCCGKSICFTCYHRSKLHCPYCRYFLYDVIIKPEYLIESNFDSLKEELFNGYKIARTKHFDTKFAIRRLIQVKSAKKVEDLPVDMMPPHLIEDIIYKLLKSLNMDDIKLSEFLLKLVDDYYNNNHCNKNKIKAMIKAEKKMLIERNIDIRPIRKIIDRILVD